MKSRTSCFNKALFRKNMTRFAPVGVLYTLCLMLGLLILLAGGDRKYDFAANLIGSMTIMAVVNLCFAPLMAQLLFGDLYSSRMCNGLHAMPVRRAELFVTNLATGLTFSLVPTALFSLVTLPILAGSIVERSGMLALYWFAGSNLQFVCCFGIAVLATMCAGNRFGMLAVYAIVQFGAYLAGLVEEVCYLPLLPGVEPTYWVSHILTPLVQLGNSLLSLPGYITLKYQFYGRESEMAASVTLDAAAWQGLTAWAVAGVAMLGLAWLLYRKRDLESAGDPLAVRWLIPVAQVLVSVTLGFLAALMVLFVLDGVPDLLIYGVLLAGITVAWFAVKMVLSRTSRVFEKRNFLRLIPVLLVVALSLAATYFDVLGLTSWTPRTENVRSVYLYSNGERRTLTNAEDVEKVVQLHTLALEDDLGDLRYSGYYNRELLQQGLPLEEVRQQTEASDYSYPDYLDTKLFRRMTYISVEYTMNSGRTVKRSMYLWVDSEAGERMRELLSDWDSFYQEKQKNNAYDYELCFDAEQVEYLYIEGSERIACTPEMANSLLAAIRADREAGNFTALNMLHQGYFSKGEEYPTSLQINLRYDPPARDLYGFTLYFDVYADSENTVAWLQEHDLLTYELVLPE